MKKHFIRLTATFLVGIIIGVLAFPIPCNFSVALQYEGESPASIDDIVYESAPFRPIKCSVGNTWYTVGIKHDMTKHYPDAIPPDTYDTVFYPSLFQRISINISLLKLMFNNKTLDEIDYWGYNHLYTNTWHPFGKPSEKNRTITKITYHDNIINFRGNRAATQLLIKLMKYARPDSYNFTDKYEFYDWVEENYGDIEYKPKNIGH